MKNNIYIFIFILPLVFISSCSSGKPTEDNRDTPVYNTPMPIIAPIIQSNPQPTPAGNAEDTDIFEFLSGFSGVDTDVVSPKQHNSPFSHLGTIGQVPFICFDYDTETLYYVDFIPTSVTLWSNDTFLYSYKDGIRQLVVEKPVNFPVYYDGVIYFTSHEDLDLLYGWSYYPAGYIYKYTIRTQTVERFGSVLAYGLNVYDDYLYFYEPWTWGAANPVGDRYRIPLKGGEPENIGDFLPFYYGEYQLKLLTDTSGRQSLVLHSSQNTITVIDYHSLTGFPYWVDFRDGRNFCLYGDLFFFRYGRGYLSINLRNGETVHYHFINNWNDERRISAIIILDNRVYALVDTDRGHRGIYYFDNENNQFNYLFIDNTNIINRINTSYYYFMVTDGNHLYFGSAFLQAFDPLVDDIDSIINTQYIKQISRNENGQYEGRLIN